MNKYILLIISLLFSSCSFLQVGHSEFSCPMPKTLNLKCMPPSEIYKLSEHKQLYKLQKEQNNIEKQNNTKKVKVKNKKVCVCQNNNSDDYIINDFEELSEEQNKEKCFCKIEKVSKKENTKTNNKNYISAKKNFQNKIILNQDDVDFLPVLQKPKIILIWFNYWIDNSGDLHSNEYVYLTVKKRHWSIGEKLFDKNKLLLSPLLNTNYNNLNENDIFSINKD